MPGSLLFTDKNDNNNLNSSSNSTRHSSEHSEQEGDEEQQQQRRQQHVNIWSSIILTENDSLLGILKRLCIYWRRILSNKIRLLFTLIFMSILNITARITCFARQRRSTQSPPSSSFNTSLTSSSIRTLEEDLTDPTKSLLFIDKTNTQQIDLPSLDNSKMAHILVQQQQTHRSPNIRIHQPTSSQKDSKLPMTHSVDDRLFSQDSKHFLHLLKRFASEPQISIYQPQTTHNNHVNHHHHHHQNNNHFTNGHLNESPVVFALTTPVSNHQSIQQINNTENDEINFDDIFLLNCDKIQPVTISLNEDFNSDKTDNLIPIINSVSNQSILNHDDIKPEQLDEDILIDTTPSIPTSATTTNTDSIITTNTNNNDNNNNIIIINHELHNGERHFRRRKRRSSLTKTSISYDDTSSTTNTSITVDDTLPTTATETVNLLEKLHIDQEQTPEIHEKLEEKLNDVQQQPQEETNSNQTHTELNGESDQTNIDDEKPAPTSRFRGRRLRHRFYRNAASAASSSSPSSPSISSSSSSSSPELPSIASTQFYLPNEALNIETPRLHSPPPSSLSSSSSVTCSPAPSPTSPPLPIPLNQLNSIASATTGGLKRVGSVGTTKKNVRFADSVGRELAQVQYINSSINDDSKELSFLLGSSLLSSSPPSFIKNNLYVPNSSGLEHKPWSFDVALQPTKTFHDTHIPRRFFCLYRQPNSEHPDIYLHEVWKSQIKLEYADIPVTCSSTGEQQLSGTIWVTNASYWKYVSVKYTFNRWLNTYEHEAQYRCHSNDFRNIDQFEFRINIPADVDRIDFVLRYCVNGQEFWDNNEGKNYTLQTESAYTPSTTISLPHDCDFNEMRFY